MSRLVVPVVAAAALGVTGTAEILLDPAFAADPAAPAAALVAVVLGAALCDRFPILGAAVAAGAFPIVAIGGLSGPTGAAILGFFLAPGWAGFRLAARRSWPAPLAAQLIAGLGTWITGQADGSTRLGFGAMAVENLVLGGLCWGAWGMGLLAWRLRMRADVLAELAAALESEQAAREHAIAVEERQRIARDMHDVVAQSINAMVLQLGAVRGALPAGTPQADMVLGVERLGHESAREMRSLVDILRDPDAVEPDRRPTLERAADLVAEVRAAGLPVDLTVEGDLAPLPKAIDISAYRVLQEALRNVLQHAGPVPTQVRLHRGGDVLTVAVENEPPVDEAPEFVNGGHGLIGMRERVAVFDGYLDVGPRPDGGFVVRAGFPTSALS